MDTRRFFRKVLTRISARMDLAARSIYRTPEEKRGLPWVLDRGDATLRVDYDLNERSVVFDLGGYEGQWAADIFSRYCCTVFVFEPVPRFAQNIEKRFRRNRNIRVYRFGLSGESVRVPISMDRDGSSTFRTGDETEEILLVRAADFMQDEKIRHIDLMKINIEGGEYDLLEHLIETGFIRNIGNIQVQFHDFVPDAERRMRSIQEALRKTHVLTYQYPFVWENWSVK